MKQILKGKIVSNKMRDTVTIKVSRLKKHSVYGKYIKVSKKYKAHTNEQIPEGKDVVIESTKPLSKDKKWKVIKIL
ncbi:MAG: 30S ribosomal protein S17 [Patescibacteria group bacterium]